MKFSIKIKVELKTDKHQKTKNIPRRTEGYCKVQICYCFFGLFGLQPPLLSAFIANNIDKYAGDFSWPLSIICPSSLQRNLDTTDKGVTSQRSYNNTLLEINLLGSRPSNTKDFSEVFPMYNLKLI